MARKGVKLGSLVKQAQDRLDSKLAIGESKYQAQKQGLKLYKDSRAVTKDKIYSWESYKSYLAESCRFLKYCKATYDLKKLDDCRVHVDEWIQKRIDAGNSASTQKSSTSALAKLFGCSTKDFIQTEVRHRSNITRSRGIKVRDRNFSEDNNRELVDFCKATGLRRAELRALTGDKLIHDEEKGYCINVNTASKGGRPRLAPIIRNVESIIEVMNSAGSNKVFDKIPNGADIHSYRADYATTFYKEIARPVEELGLNLGVKGGSTGDAYVCRGDLKGTIYDRKAMEVVSNALGHNRISVIAGHYLRSSEIL